MKVLILGGTGTISREIVRQLLEKGHRVVVYNRGNRKCPCEQDIQVLHGDRRDRADFAEKMARINVDAVIDMIAYDQADARQTWEVFHGRTGQIIVTSSIAAYQRPYRSYPVREDMEVLSRQPEFSYGFQKAEMERFLQERMGQGSTPITILRPSLTFGNGTENFGILRQNRNVVRRIREGRPLVMVGEGVIPWSFTFAPDLASAYVLSCGNKNTYNRCFHVTNTELAMWEDLYRAVGAAVGKQPDLCYIPSALLREFDPKVCGHLYFEKVHFSLFSIEKFQKAVPEYQPEIGLNRGVSQLIRWWEESDFPYDEKKDALEDQICALYGRFKSELLSMADGGRRA